MSYFVRRYDVGNGPPFPPRIRAAFDYLEHVRMITTQDDASVPVRELSALEKSVELAALRAVQQYLLGEMDFAESPAAKPPKSDGEGGSAPAAPGSAKKSDEQ
jgi:hypothetical protein